MKNVFFGLFVTCVIINITSWLSWFIVWIISPIYYNALYYGQDGPDWWTHDFSSQWMFVNISLTITSAVLGAITGASGGFDDAPKKGKK